VSDLQSVYYNGDCERPFSTNSVHRQHHLEEPVEPGGIGACQSLSAAESAWDERRAEQLLLSRRPQNLVGLAHRPPGSLVQRKEPAVLENEPLSIHYSEELSGNTGQHVHAAADQQRRGSR